MTTSFSFIRCIAVTSIIVTAIIGCLTNCSDKSTSNEKQSTTDQDTTKPEALQTEINPYEGMRDRAFTPKPEDLGLSLPADKTTVYGVIMDWEMGRVTATLVSYLTGEASVILNSGGGIITGEQENVNMAAKQFVSLAQTFLDKATKTESTSLPARNEVNFYLLTNDGIYVGREQVENFNNNSSTWSSLFKEGNDVLTELRKASGK